jgi:hypothetical protein
VACPAVAAATLHYVDPVNGVDNPAAGGGTGACAYKTITYALTQATGQINLAPGTYSNASGEAFPITLTGTQSLNGTSGVVVEGNGATNAYTIDMQGTSNSVNGFAVVNSAVTGSTMCIHGGPNCDGVVTNMDISHCAFAFFVTSNQFGFVGNNIHDMGNSGTRYLNGLVLDPAGGVSVAVSGSVTNNTFSGPAAEIGDIDCAGIDVSTFGSGNRDNGADVSCSECMYCPFH